MRITYSDRKFLRAMHIEAPETNHARRSDLIRWLDDQVNATAAAEEDRARWRRKYYRLRESVIWMVAVLAALVWAAVMIGWWPR